MKRGLVLEGGAMRGMYTAGVIDVLMENNIHFDGTIGVSAGAAFGCNYKSQQIGRVIRYNKKFCNDHRFVGFRSLIRTGNIYNVDFGYSQIPLIHDPFDSETFEKHPSEFYVVCTDVATGNPVYKKLDKGDQVDTDWIRASASMPLVSKPVEIDGMELLDGGISDSIPIHWFRSIGYKKNLVVLTRPKGYTKKEAKGYMIDLLLRKYPHVANAMKNRSKNYNETLKDLEEMEKDNSIFIIQPSEDLQIKRIEKDPEKLELMYQLGRKDAQNNLNEIIEFLKK